jgi:hypothetical protein
MAIAEGSRRSAGNILLVTDWIYKNNPIGKECGRKELYLKLLLEIPWRLSNLEFALIISI